MKSYLRQKLEKPQKNHAHNLTFLKTGIFLILMTLLLTSFASAQVEFRDSNGFDFYNDLGIYSDLSVEDGNISMNNNRILGLPEPTSSGEPLTQGSGSGDYVDRTGDSMSGDLDIQDNWLLGDSGELNLRNGGATFNGSDQVLELDQTMPATGNPATLLFKEDGNSNWAFVSMQDGGLGIYDFQANEIVQEFNENGEIELRNRNVGISNGLEISSGNLNLSNNINDINKINDINGINPSGNLQLTSDLNINSNNLISAQDVEFSDENQYINGERVQDIVDSSRKSLEIPLDRGNFAGVPSSDYNNILDQDETISTSLWVRIDELPDNWGQMIGNSDQGWQIRQYSSTNQVAWNLRCSDSNIFSYDLRTPDINDGKWHHIVGTYDGTNSRGAIYLDGEKIEERNSLDSCSVIDNDSSRDVDDYELKIGEPMKDTNGRRFEGGLDNIRVYDRELSETEVKELYKDNEVSTGLIGHWPIQDDSQTLEDVTNNGNDAEVVGSADVKNIVGFQGEGVQKVRGDLSVTGQLKAESIENVEQKELGFSQSNPASDCQEINQEYKSLDDGYYWIQPGGLNSPFKAYCDMTFDGGGWTMIESADLSRSCAGTDHPDCDSSDANYAESAQPFYNKDPINMDSPEGNVEDGAYSLNANRIEELESDSTKMYARTPTKHTPYSHTPRDYMITDSSNALNSLGSDSVYYYEAVVDGYNIVFHQGNNIETWNRASEPYHYHICSGSCGVPGAVGSQDYFGFYANGDPFDGSAAHQGAMGPDALTQYFMR
jgi:hypothetical protein